MRVTMKSLNFSLKNIYTQKKEFHLLKLHVQITLHVQLLHKIQFCQIYFVKIVFCEAAVRVVYKNLYV